MLVKTKETPIMKAFRMLNQFTLQQRKRNIVIYTNSKKMQTLLTKTHPNIRIELLPPLSVLQKQEEELYKPLLEIDGYPNYKDYK